MNKYTEEITLKYILILCSIFVVGSFLIGCLVGNYTTNPKLNAEQTAQAVLDLQAKEMLKVSNTVLIPKHNLENRLEESYKKGCKDTQIQYRNYFHTLGLGQWKVSPDDGETYFDWIDLRHQSCEPDITKLDRLKEYKSKWSKPNE